MAKKTYKVIGPFVTHETAPGGTFSAALDRETERLMIEQGAIEVVAEKKAASSGSGSKKGASTSSADTDTGGGS